MDVLNGSAKNTTFEQCGPALDGFAVTPSDSTVFTGQVKGLYIGTGGDVNVVTLAGTTILFKAVPTGTFMPVMVQQVLATSTTASNIVALY